MKKLGVLKNFIVYLTKDNFIFRAKGEMPVSKKEWLLNVADYGSIVILDKFMKKKINLSQDIIAFDIDAQKKIKLHQSTLTEAKTLEEYIVIKNRGVFGIDDKVG